MILLLKFDNQNISVSTHLMHLWYKHLHGIWLHKTELCFPPASALKRCYTHALSFINDNILLSMYHQCKIILVCFGLFPCFSGLVYCLYNVKLYVTGFGKMCIQPLYFTHSILLIRRLIKTTRIGIQFWKYKGMVILQSLKVLHLYANPNSFYNSPKLKNWWLMVCTILHNRPK